MSVGDINVKLGLDTTAFSTALAGAKAQALALGGSFDGLGKSLNNLGVGGGPLGNMGKALGEIATASNLAVIAVGAIGVAAVAVGAKLAGMAAEYQQAMAKVAATTGMSNEKLKEMQSLMYENAAKGSRLDMVTQAKIAGGLGGAGLIGSNTDAAEQLKLLQLTEKAMVALEAPVEDTIDLFAILQTRYGANTEQMSRTTSSVAQMADETSATNSEIVQATLTMGRLASTVHMTQPELVALAAATKSSGTVAAEVGTQWSSLVKNLSSETEGASAAFKELGMDQEDWFKALQESKNTGSNAPVLRFLKDLDKNLQKSDNSAKQSMQLFGQYGLTVGGNLAQIIGKYETLIVKSQTAYDENVRIEQEYKRMTDTMGSMLDAIGAKFNAIGVRMGTALLAPIQDATYQFDQFLGKVMQGDFAGAWRGMYDAVLDYDWVGAGASIASMIASGLVNLASFGANAIAQLGVSILTHDWIGSGRSIADKIVSGLSGIGASARSALGNVSDWVDSGGARAAGEGLANWVIQGAQSVFNAGVDLLGWLRTNFTMDKISGIVRAGFQMTGEMVRLGIQIGSDFISGIAKGVTDAGGSYFSGIITEAGKLVESVKKLGLEIAKTGLDWINDTANRILTAVSGKIQPYLDIVNRTFGTSYSMPTSTGITTQAGDIGGAASGVRDQWGNLIGAIMPGQEYVPNKPGQKPLAPSSATSQSDFMEQLGAQGVDFNQAYSMLKSYDWGKQTITPEKNARLNWGLGATSLPGQMAGLSGMQGLTNIAGAYKGSTTAGKAGATATTGAIDNLGKEWGGGVVPVFVTNWEGGAGGAGGAAGGTTSVNQYGQTVDANGLPIGKFDASKINNTGPGIGMVKTDGGNTNAAYADRLSIDTCEIDSFGMTPGLGLELANSGAWRPNAGAASQKLAAEIGYGGDYADPGQYGALVGGMNQIVKTQTTTANKVSGITVGAATKATGITIGGMQQASYSFQTGTAGAAKAVGNTMEAGALNAKISLEDGGYSCFNAIDGGAHTFSQEMALSAAEQKSASVVARDNIQAGGQHVKENSLSSSLDFKNTIGTAGTDFKNNVNAGATSWTTALGSGLTSLAGIASYITGGSGAMVGGGYTSAGNGITQTPWGAGSFGGTSIGGGGSWVGTGASYSGAGAAAVAGKGFTSSNNVKWFADGGIITKPSIVGVGEAGTEAIVPIGKLPDIMSQAMGGAGGAQMVHTVINVDGKRLADVTGPAIIKRVQQGAGLKVR